jgi:uridine kinase
VTAKQNRLPWSSSVDSEQAVLEEQKMANKILIHVSGYCGSGKSTITEIISKALTEHGIMTEHDYNSVQYEHPVYRPETLAQRVSSLKDKETVVVMYEVQQRRSSITQ